MADGSISTAAGPMDDDFGGNFGEDVQMFDEPPVTHNLPAPERPAQGAGNSLDYRVEEYDGDDGGQTFEKSSTVWETQRQNEMAHNNPHFPFRDADEWELVQELAVSSDSNEWLNRLLKCKLVSMPSRYRLLCLLSTALFRSRTKNQTPA